LDLMIHDLDLVHQLISGRVRNVQARGRIEKAHFADQVSAAVLFENGAVARLETSRIAENRRRGMRAVYADGVVEIDFLTHKVTNTTPRGLNALEMGDPLAESVGAFVAAAKTGKAPLVRPEQARRALQTALLIDEASERSSSYRDRGEIAAYLAAN
jgi:predicted dehydrogenase